MNWDHNDYNNLSKEAKEMFFEFNAPARLKVGETIVRRYTLSFTNDNWFLPEGNELLAKSEKGVNIKLTYIKQKANRIGGITRKGLYEDDRGIYKDPKGNKRNDIFIKSGFGFKIVDDLQEEINFLTPLCLKAAPTPRTIVVPIVEDIVIEKATTKEGKDLTDEDKKAIYTRWKEAGAAYSRKEFAEKEGLSDYMIRKIIKDYDLPS
jgi:hypothetical protein